MALIKCAECGREISDKAAACPGCGAPQDVLFQTAAAPVDVPDDATESHWSTQAATHCDGNILFYDEPSRAFALRGAVLSLRDVWDLEVAKTLSWARHDLREVMMDSVMGGVAMGDSPATGAPSKLDRTVAFLEKVGSATAPKSAAMVCPHCQSKGTIRTKQVKQKKGVSGGKATAAVLTGGLSILATGLSRKESATQARCSKCGNTWYF